MKKNWLSVLLCIIMCVTLIPVQTFAEETANVNSGISQIKDGDSVYFGNDTTYNIQGEIKWRILDADKTNTNEDGMFLITERVLGTGYWGGVYFEENITLIGDSYYKEKDLGTKANIYQNSDAQEWCHNFSGENAESTTKAFTAPELNALLAVTKSDAAYTSTNYNIQFNKADNILNGDKVFFLSTQEAEEYFATNEDRTAIYEDVPGDWWLRSPLSGNQDYMAGKILGEGLETATDVRDDYPARPACNINLSSVLFVSAAEGGKVSGAIGVSALNKYSVPAETTAWKFTLKDADRAAFTAKLSADSSNKIGAGETLKVDYSNALTGTNEYVSAAICDTSGNIIYYGNIVNTDTSDSSNGTGTEITIPADLAAGSYTLNIFSEQCNGDKKTDYAGDFKAIPLTILPKEPTPEAVFMADGENNGTLSNVTVDMKYSIDGSTWNDITNVPMMVTGVTVNDGIKVYQPGIKTVTADSEIQSITVTRSDKPIGISSEPCTTSAQNDGKIINVDDTMEYKLSTDAAWISVPSSTTELGGFSNGSYHVRVKAAGTALASEPETVIISEHICTPDGTWYSDETNHWQVCSSCNTQLNEAAHSGGTANCQHGAVCEVCTKEYGVKDETNHTGTVVWQQTETTHAQIYNCCQTVVIKMADHILEDGKCTVCGYPCIHSQGTATCMQAAVCELCGAAYGDVDPDNHKAETVWIQENGKHYHKCEYGCTTHLDEAVCSGGEADCMSKAVCAICHNAYGEVDAGNHSNLEMTEAKAATHIAEGNTEYYYCAGCNKYYRDAAGTEEITLADTIIPVITGHTADNTGWHKDETNHWNICQCGEILDTAAHTFEWITDKEASTSGPGSKHEKCTVCGYEKDAIEIPVIKIPVSEPVSYSFIKGADGTYIQNSGSGYVIEINGDFDKFQNVSVDGTTVDKKNYAAKSGSTIITFAPDYMNTLSIGKHTIVVNFTDGTATTSLTVKEKAAAKKDTTHSKKTASPETGDPNHVFLWYVIMLIGGGIVAGSLFVRKKNK